MRDRMSEIFWHPVTVASRAPRFPTTWPRNDGLWGREWCAKHSCKVKFLHLRPFYLRPLWKPTKEPAYPASRGYIFSVWAGVRKVASADNRSIFYRACAKFAIRDSQATGSSNLREFRGNQTWENYMRTTLLELLFCFSASPPLVLSILAAKFPQIVFSRKVFLCYQLQVLSVLRGAHFSGFNITYSNSCAQSEKWNSPTTLRRSDSWNKLDAVVSRLRFTAVTTNTRPWRVFFCLFKPEFSWTSINCFHGFPRALTEKTEKVPSSLNEGRRLTRIISNEGGFLNYFY